MAQTIEPFEVDEWDVGSAGRRGFVHFPKERMIQLSATSLDSESGSTPISAEEAFVSVMGKDRSGRIHCGGSRETHRT
ncbi:hypothetical protein Taro_052537 [Colocasia esculenta]|uniref:Uncharacterized protein n=1 Tax=Colocasia esculenta TaxID=4460 RepID=A0A843XK77_COLES|nr:hypothetical protein [Colocasia esculenta]